MSSPAPAPPWPLVLLMPTVRHPRPDLRLASPTSSPRSPRTKHISSKRLRALAELPDSLASPSKDIGHLWFARSARFDVVQDQLELEGYQLYAVEKWCDTVSDRFSPHSTVHRRVTERTRPVVTLAVYTGVARDKVCLNQPRPPPRGPTHLDHRDRSQSLLQSLPKGGIRRVGLSHP